jgi:hypothetical protein
MTATRSGVAAACRPSSQCAALKRSLAAPGWPAAWSWLALVLNGRFSLRADVLAQNRT